MIERKTNIYFSNNSSLIHSIEDLVQAVQELGRGSVSGDTLNLLHRLNRPLPPGEPPVQLFALNYDVEKCNSDHLLDMEGMFIHSLVLLNLNVGQLTFVY